MRVHVDEAGCHDLARRVQVAPGGFAVQIADRRDTVVHDADVRSGPRAPGAVDDLRALDLEIKHGRVRVGAAGARSPPPHAGAMRPGGAPPPTRRARLPPWSG